MITVSDQASGSDTEAVGGARPWAATEADRLVGKGHGAGDILEAWRWRVLERGRGHLVVEAHLPDRLKNPQGQLFGGFTTAYIDFVSLHTVHANDDGEGPRRDPSSPGDWLTTLNLHCDYFEPIVDPTFIISGELLNQRGMNSLVSTKFFQGDPTGTQTMAAHGLATLRRVPVVAPSTTNANGATGD